MSPFPLLREARQQQSFISSQVREMNWLLEQPNKHQSQFKIEEEAEAAIPT